MKYKIVFKSLSILLTAFIFVACIPSSNDIIPELPPEPELIPGNELRIDTYQFSVSKNARLAMDANGNFVATWTTIHQDGDNYGVFARRFDSSGTAQGEEFQVNTTTQYQQSNQSIAMDDNGNFIITWQSRDQDGSSYGIFAQRYNLIGVAQGSEFQVNTYTSNNQKEPSVAMNANGNFVISWTSWAQDGDLEGIFAQRFNAEGDPQGTELQVNTSVTHNQEQSSIAIDDDGNFVVVWHSYDSIDNDYNVFGQRFDSTGTPRGNEFRVNNTTEGYQVIPDVACDASGNFVITWKEEGASKGISARRYNSDGDAEGLQFQVNSYDNTYQSYPRVTMSFYGDFAITWENLRQDDGVDKDVYLQRYDSNGNPLGMEVRVNTNLNGNQVESDIATAHNGNIVIVWTSYGQNPGGAGLYGKLYYYQ